MAFPAGWPPRPASSVRSIRFYTTGTATANFTDNGFLFASGAGANTLTPTPYVPPGGERTQAILGSATVSGSPMGGGRNTNDSNSDPRVNSPPPPVAQIWAGSIRVTATTADLEISFDGTNVQGIVKLGTSAVYLKRYESGIAVRGAGTFYVEAW